MNPKRLLLGAGLGLLTATALNWLVLEEEYASYATIRSVPSLLPERFVGQGMPLDMAAAVESGIQEALSRNMLTNIIMTHDLLRDERRLMPMEDVIEKLRSRVVVRRESESVLRLTARDRNPSQAQKICRGLITRFADGTMRQREVQAKMVVSFLEEESREAARQWEVLIKAARESGGGERQVLERDMARKQYESLRSKLAEAQMAAGLERRKQGPSLEFIDPPSLPEHPSNLSRASVLGLGGGLGVALALLFEASRWLFRNRTHRGPAYGEA